jgi:hypothetical protein
MLSVKVVLPLMFSSKSLRRQVRQILIVLAVGSLLFLVYRAMQGKSADLLYYTNLAAQFTLILMGVFLSTHEAWVKKYSKLTVLAFVIVGGIAMLAAVRQAQENMREANEANRKLAGLTTGGDSFCYVQFLTHGENATLVVLQRGDFPLADVMVKLIDSDTATFESTMNNQPFNVGTLPVKGSKFIGTVSLGHLSERKFLAAFSAKNGQWDQLVVLRRLNNEWRLAMRVQRNPGQIPFEELEKPRERIYDFTEAGFPGTIDETIWDHFNGLSLYCTNCK